MNGCDLEKQKMIRLVGVNKIKVEIHKIILYTKYIDGNDDEYTERNKLKTGCIL